MNSSLRTKTDNELIQNFQDGDVNALEALVLRHKDKMYTSILFLVKDKYLAEDIFQDSLIKIIDTILTSYTELLADGTDVCRVACLSQGGTARYHAEIREPRQAGDDLLG